MSTRKKGRKEIIERWKRENPEAHRLSLSKARSRKRDRAKWRIRRDFNNGLSCVTRLGRMFGAFLDGDSEDMETQCLIYLNHCLKNTRISNRRRRDGNAPGNRGGKKPKSSVNRKNQI